jgi:hypothetical protein
MSAIPGSFQGETTMNGVVAALMAVSLLTEPSLGQDSPRGIRGDSAAVADARAFVSGWATFPEPGGGSRFIAQLVYR